MCHKMVTQMYHVHVVQVQTTDQLYILNHFTTVCNTQVPVLTLLARAWFNDEHSKHTGVRYMTLTLHVIHVCTHVPGVYPGTL